MRLTKTLLHGLGVAVIGGVLGCALYVEDDPCRSVTCSDNASCSGGTCFCDNGFSGNPYNDQGCLPTWPDSDGSTCDPGCGAGAHCADNACVCNVGHVSVCGDGTCTDEALVCDGEYDCPNGADEDMSVCNPPVEVELLITDECDDGLDIDYRLFSEDRDWVWPASGVFTTGGLFTDTYEEITCLQGEAICFGGAAGEFIWGVGLEGTDSCPDCCWICDAYFGPVDLGRLTCN